MACLGSARLSQVYTTPSVAASVPRNGSSSGASAGQELRAACVSFPVRSSNGECSDGALSAHKVVKGLRGGGVARSEFLKGGDHGELLRRVVGEVQDVAAAKKTTSNKKLREAGVATAMAVSTADEKKILTGHCGAVLEDVPHLTDWLPNLPVRSEGRLTCRQPADRTISLARVLLDFSFCFGGSKKLARVLLALIVLGHRRISPECCFFLFFFYEKEDDECQSRSKNFVRVLLIFILGEGGGEEGFFYETALSMALILLAAECKPPRMLPLTGHMRLCHLSVVIG